METRTEWPSLSEFKDLYSSDPEKRYQASRDYGEKNVDQKFAWRFGCRGSANAWLVLLGPSPGNAKPGELRQAQDPKIGDKVCEIKFGEGVGRNPRFKAISEAGFGTNAPKDLSQKLTALLNLDDGNSPDGRQIDPQLLKKGCPFVFDRLNEARPRVIIVLSFPAWNPFTDFLRDRSKPLSPPAVYPNGKSLLAFTFRISPELEFDTLILKSRQHPSMPFFKIGRDDVAIAKTVDWFLQTQSGL
jgi:hypothetical protein